MNFFSFNFPLREYFFCTWPPRPHKFSNGPSLSRKWDGDQEEVTVKRKGVSGSPGLADFANGLVNSVLKLREVFWGGGGEFKLQKKL